MTVDRAAAEAAYQEANRLREAGDLAGAERAYARTADMAPSQPAPHHWIGYIRQLLGDPVGAEQAFRRALALEPGRAISQHGLGSALVGQGRLAEGFPLMEARHRVPGRPADPPLPFRRWAGEDLTGKRILIWPEEGFGDQIQYARYAKALPSRGVTAWWYCAPELAALFADSELGVTILPAAGSVDLPAVDYLVRSSSLPALFPSDDIPPAPYLTASARASAHRIGVMPFGNSKQVNDLHRRLSEDAAQALLALPGALSLRPEATGAADFRDTAQIIAGLDLVITVDTAVAHLSGALGKPTWILLPFIGADWRWAPSRETSPWYLSARLFRQPAPGDWQAVVERVAAKLP